MFDWVLIKEATAFAVVLSISVYLVRYITEAGKKSQATTAELMGRLLEESMAKLKEQGDVFATEIGVQREERHLMCASHLEQLSRLGDSTTKRLDQIGMGFAEVAAALKKQNGGD